MNKLAIIQCADAGPLESLVDMLESVGYECRIPDDALRAELKKCYGGEGLVLSPKDLTRGAGYDPVSVPEVGPAGMHACNLFVDVKAHQVCCRVEDRWPWLRGNVLWYRINGGEPEHCVNQRGDHGNEVEPPCPVLTPNQWYGVQDHECDPAVKNRRWRGLTPAGLENSYCCWPPFVRRQDYYNCNARPYDVGREDMYTDPVCLVHNFQGWGYGPLLPAMRKLGVRVYGQGSPDGLIQHRDVPGVLSRALAMVHLKSSDAPGYAIYECLAAGCPLVCTQKLLWKCNMEALLEPCVTCLTFDRPTHDPFTDKDLRDCEFSVGAHLRLLADKAMNKYVGDRGRRRLDEVLWSKDRPRDVDSLRAFMARHFEG
jgi:hypothetical protein